MQNTGLVFFYMSVLSALLPIVIGIKRRLSLIWLYVLTSFIFDLLILLLRWGLELNFFWAANLFVISEFLLISFIYKDKILKKNIPFYITIGTVLSIFLAMTFNQPKGFLDFNTLGYSFISLVFITYVMAGFYRMLQDPTEVYLEKSSFFWVNTAFLIYASGNFLLFLFNKYLQQNNDLLFIILWSISFKVLNILKNVLLAVALSKKEKH